MTKMCSDDLKSKIICPNDGKVFHMAINSITVCFNIIKHLPKVQDSKELTGILIYSTNYDLLKILLIKIIQICYFHLLKCSNLGCLMNRLKTAESEHSKIDEIDEFRKDFKGLLNVYGDEYRKSKSWCELLNLTHKRMEDNFYEQKSKI